MTAARRLRPSEGRFGELGPAQSRTERFRTHDAGEAEHIVTETYLPHELWVSDAHGVDFSITRAQFGQTTGGVVSYGQTIQIHTEETTDFHVNVVLEGRGASSSGRSEPLNVSPGQAFLFKVGEPAHLTWSADCRQLALKTPRAKIESELEKLLGRHLPKPLAFEAGLRVEVGQLWRSAVDLVAGGLDQGSEVLTCSSVGEHLEGLLINGLLLTQSHNYRELVFRDTRPGPAGAIGRAAELLEELPHEPWTVVVLAQQVGLSVRALQYGFNRDFELPPMAYLRQVRLRQARNRLQDASPNTTTVRAVALECGLTHLGRFAAAYRRTFGESPSETLAKQL